IAEAYPAVRVALGVHPNHAQVYTPAVAEELRELSRTRPRIVAIGETGLDFYRDNAPRDKQYESFREHLKIAAELDLPFILHCRASETELLGELSRERGRIKRPLRGVWHCF